MVVVTSYKLIEAGEHDIVVPMSEFENLIETNSQAAEDLVLARGDLNRVGAELILCNLAATVDLLAVEEFVELSDETRSSIMKIAEIGEKIVPPEDDEQEIYAGEPIEEQVYREHMISPIRALRRAVSRGHFEQDGHEQEKDVRSAVLLAASAFKGVLEEQSDDPVFNDTVRYFRRNTETAAKIASLIQLTQLRSPHTA
jgi:hypothetical protein